MEIHEHGVKSLSESGSCSESDSTARVESLRVLLCGSVLLVQEVVVAQQSEMTCISVLYLDSTLGNMNGASSTARKLECLLKMPMALCPIPEPPKDKQRQRTT
jgi:hypothetical protein|uniref:Uncharacterized protein n=1 Tax=Mus musculus TaxID=10090 RepID=Q3TH72_MOUSE|nr:unnamed protein product [Mus musculus]